jgi:restriction system protein
MIPPFQELMLPIMRLAKSKGEESTPNREFIDRMGQEFNLTEEDRRELLASGTQSRFENRVYWALVHLRRAGLLESTGRGMNRITQRGEEVLAAIPKRIDLKLLNQFSEFRDFRAGKPDGGTGDVAVETVDASPEETLDEEYKRLRKALAIQITERLRDCSPTFFERIVVELLVKMGWVTAVLARRRVAQHVRRPTAVLTVSSMKIAWGWIRFMSKRKDGKIQLENRNCEIS